MPPKAPVITRAVISIRNPGDRPQNNVPSRKPAYRVKNAVLRPNRSMIDEAKSPDKPGADGVARYDQAELMGCDSQLAHQRRAQGHHDHEVDDVRELDRRQNQ